MAKIRPYKKVGNYNWEEKRLIKDIIDAIEKKIEKDPSFTYTPANNLEELKQMFVEQCTTSVEFTETKNNTGSSETESGTHNNAETDPGASEPAAPSTENTESAGPTAKKRDPFNRAKVDMRAYMTENDFPGDRKVQEGTEQTNFEEPNNFQQSFRMPTPDDVKGQEPKPTTGQTQASSATGPGTKAAAPAPSNTTVSSSPSEADQKRKTKRFARSVVRIVSALYKVGIVYWATKDINEAKIVQHELKGEIDFSLLVSLSEEQQITVRQFFSSQETQIKVIAEITEPEQDRLADSLAELMHEKNIKPTAGQDMLVNALEVLGVKTMQIIGIQQQGLAVLKQLMIVTKQNREILSGNNAGNSGGDKNDGSYGDESNPDNEQSENNAAQSDESAENNNSTTLAKTS